MPNAFTESSGKQFVRSPARQRLAGGGGDDLQGGFASHTPMGRLTVNWYQPMGPYPDPLTADNLGHSATDLTIPYQQAALMDYSGIPFTNPVAGNYPPPGSGNHDNGWNKWVYGPPSAVTPLGPWADPVGVADQHEEGLITSFAPSIVQLMPALFPPPPNTVATPGGAFAGWAYHDMPATLIAGNQWGYAPGYYIGNRVSVSRSKFKTIRSHSGFFFQTELWFPDNFTSHPTPPYFRQYRNLRFISSFVLSANAFIEIPLPSGGYAGPIRIDLSGGPYFIGRATVAIVGETRDQFSARTGLTIS